MSDKLPVLTGKELIKLLERWGFIVTRVKGSHHRMRNEDGRVTTIPLHKNDPISKGLLRKIIREDLLLSFEEFNRLLEDK